MLKTQLMMGRKKIDRFLVHIVQEYFENPALNLSLMDMVILFNSFSESSLLQTANMGGTSNTGEIDHIMKMLFEQDTFKHPCKASSGEMDKYCNILSKIRPEDS